MLIATTIFKRLLPLSAFVLCFLVLEAAIFQQVAVLLAFVVFINLPRSGDVFRLNVGVASILQTLHHDSNAHANKSGYELIQTSQTLWNSVSYPEQPFVKMSEMDPVEVVVANSFIESVAVILEWVLVLLGMLFIVLSS